jgi:hypothetical protein
LSVIAYAVKYFKLPLDGTTKAFIHTVASIGVFLDVEPFPEYIPGEAMLFQSSTLPSTCLSALKVLLFY